MNQKPLSEPERLVYDALCGVHMHFAGKATLRIIQSDLWRSGLYRKSENTVRKRLSSLEERGLIETVKGERRQLYYRPLPVPDEPV